MNEERIKEMLNEINIPFAYMKFDEDTISPPYMVWYHDESSAFYADGISYCRIDSIVIELYADEYDRGMERKIEEVLTAHELGFRAQRVYLDDEEMYETIYLTEVLGDAK